MLLLSSHRDLECNYLVKGTNHLHAQIDVVTDASIRMTILNKWLFNNCNRQHIIVTYIDRQQSPQLHILYNICITQSLVAYSQISHRSDNFAMQSVILRYYSINKTFMSQIGTWPYQRRSMRILIPSLIVFIDISYLIPEVTAQSLFNRSFILLRRTFEVNSISISCKYRTFLNQTHFI